MNIFKIIQQNYLNCVWYVQHSMSDVCMYTMSLNI